MVTVTYPSGKVVKYAYNGNGKKRKRNGNTHVRVNLSRAQKGLYRRTGYYGMNRQGDTELKFIDQLFGFVNTGVTGVVIDILPDIQQGTAESARIGRNIVVKRIQVTITYRISVSILASETSANVRFMIMLDKQANGTIATAGQVLETGNIMSFMNLANRHRFRILKDVFYSSTAESGAYDGVNTVFGFESRIVRFYLPVDLKIEYSGSVGVIGERRSNNIFMLVIGDTQRLSYSLNVRFRYTG